MNPVKNSQNLTKPESRTTLDDSTKISNGMNPVKNSQWYTYILLSNKDNLLYTGCTNNLNKRIKEHNNGKVFNTKNRLPLKLIYFELCLNKKDAYAREKYLKSGMGKKYIKNRLKNYFISI